MKTQLPKENKMGTMAIPQLVITMGFPLMLSMLTQSLYNIVDSMFVSFISEHSLTAVSLAFPVQNLMVAFATGTGVGINAILSKRLGQHRVEEANIVARHAFFLVGCTFLGFVILGLLFIPAYFQSQTNNTDILQQSIEYTQIVVFGGFGLFGVIASNRLLQSTGKTVYCMMTQIFSVVVNIILDPILIFGLLGMPCLGIRGAAYATIIAQILAMCLGLYFNKTKNIDLNLSLKHFKPQKEIILRIYKVGFPSIVMASIGSVMVYAVNAILAMFSTTAIAVFGIFFKLNSFATMPVMGLNNGIVPIIAYNYGAKNKSRLLHTISFSTILGFGLTVIATLIFQLFPVQLLGFFNPSQEMIAIGVPALRILSISFLGAGVCIVFSGLFQAFGNSLFSLIMSLIRQLIFIVPVAYLFSLTGNLQNVWWCFPIAEIASLVMAVFFMIHLNKKILSKLDV